MFSQEVSSAVLEASLACATSPSWHIQVPFYMQYEHCCHGRLHELHTLYAWQAKQASSSNQRRGQRRQ